MDETSYCVLQPISEYRSERVTKKSNRLTLARITTKRLCGCFTLDRSVGGCRVGRNSYLRRSFRPSVRLSVSPFVCLSVFRRVSLPIDSSPCRPVSRVSVSFQLIRFQIAAGCHSLRHRHASIQWRSQQYVRYS